MRQKLVNPEWQKDTAECQTGTIDGLNVDEETKVMKLCIIRHFQGMTVLECHFNILRDHSHEHTSHISNLHHVCKLGNTQAHLKEDLDYVDDTVNQQNGVEHDLDVTWGFHVIVEIEGVHFELDWLHEVVCRHLDVGGEAVKGVLESGFYGPHDLEGFSVLVNPISGFKVRDLLLSVCFV